MQIAPHLSESTPCRVHGNTLKCPETAPLRVKRLRHALWPSCSWKRARASRSRPFIAQKHVWRECHPAIPFQMDISVAANNLRFGRVAVSTGDFAQLRRSVANIWRALATRFQRTNASLPVIYLQTIIRFKNLQKTLCSAHSVFSSRRVVHLNLLLVFYCSA